MYKVKVDEKLLCFTGSVNGMEYVTDPDVKLVVNGVDSFSFAIYPQHPLYREIECKVSRVKIWRGSELLFYGEVTGYSQDMYGIRTYDCEGALAWLNDLHFAYAISGATPKDVLYWYIKMYNQKLRDKSKSFELGTVTVHKAMTQDGTEGTIARSSGVYPSFWEEIQDKLLDSFGGILRVRYVGSDTCAGYIDWLAIPDGTCSQDVRYAKNLLNCDWTYDCTALATAVVPLGKRKDSSGDNEVRLTIDKADDDDATFMIQYMTGTDDLVKSGNMVYSKSRMEKYGLIQQTVTFDDITDAGTLAYQGAVWLRQNGKAASTIRAEAIDLADIDESVEHFTHGDYVRTKLPGDSAESLFPITAIEIPIAAPENAKLTVGTQESGITSESGGQGGGSITNAGSGADAMAHTHSNKSVLDKITEQDYADFKGAVNKAHTHSNKGVLDKTEQPYTTAERDKLAGLENYTHPTYTAHTKGFYKFASDGEGHVTDAEEVTASDLYNAGGVIKNFLNFADYTGHMSIAFMSTGTSGSFGDYAEFVVDTRETSVSKMFMLSVGGNGIEGSLMLKGQNGSECVIFPNSNSSNSNQFHFFLPDKSGTVALTEDIPDISGKQDKLTAGTNITINGNTISAKDTTYSDATQSAHGLMAAADKKKLDGMDLSKYLPLHGTADQSKALSNGSMRYGWCVNNAANADSGYRWFRIGTLALSKLAFDTETMYLHVCSGYSNYGVLCVYTRIDSTGVGVQTIRLSWLNKSEGTLPPKFKLVGIGSSDGVKFELWCYTPSRWESVAYYVVADLKLTGGLLNRWLLEKHSDPDAKSATTVGTKSVTDVDLSYAAKANEAATLTDSGWITPTITGTASSTLRYRKQGKIVCVSGYVQPSAAGATITPFTLPTGYRPPSNIQIIHAVDSSSQDTYLVVIEKSGTVRYVGKKQGFFSTNTSYYMHVTYFID